VKKFRTLLCLIAIVFSMAACGKNDAQVRGSLSEAESSVAESASQFDSIKGLENVDVSSADMDSTETVSETMTESAGSDEAEGMTESAVMSETEIMPETEPGETAGTETDIQNNTEENEVTNMNVQVADVVFSATLEENEAVSALVKMMRESPVVIQMSDYSGFEKVGPLGTSLPANNSQTTTQAGDIVLYNGNQIVIFYGSNSWSYTRLGHIDDLTGWEEALGSGDVTVTFSLE
jgi:hypothetical protein